ncbi:MAG: hypothetical protein IPL52_14555 [Flavobacteriales bacterium]|nr:hypothetical protein [Flavobacteriales bacterium]
MRNGPRLPLCLLIAALLLVGPITAQRVVPEKYIRVEPYGVDQGLPQGLVNTIIQDRSGYIWFGTKDGLARQDGYAFTLFRHDDHDSTSLCGYQVRRLFEDSRGYIWVGTMFSGLDRYDPRTGRFQHAHRAGKDDMRGEGGISSLAEDPAGNIWVRSDSLYVVPAGTVDAIPMLVDPNKLFPGIRPLPHAIPMTISSRGDLWLSNMDSIQCIRFGEDGKPTHHQWPTAFPPGKPTDWREPSRFFEDTAKSRMIIWGFERVVTIGLDDLVPRDTVAVPYPGPLGASLFDSRGKLWCGFDHAPMLTMDLDRGMLEVMLRDVMVGDRKEGGHILVPHMEDRNGNIWFVTNGYGAFKKPADNWPFQRYTMGDRWPWNADLTGDVLFSFKPWVLLDQDGKEVPMDWPKVFPSLNRDDIMEHIAADQDGHILTGWCDWKLNRKQLLWRGLDHAWHEVPGLMEEDRPIEIYPGSDHDAWVTVSLRSNEGRLDHLLRVDLRNGTITGKYHFRTQPIEREYRGISELTVAGDGELWMATTTGLLALRPDDGSWKEFHNIPGDSTSLPMEMVLSIRLDPREPDHYLWVGTEGGGMARMDMHTGHFKRITSTNGLPNDVVYAIVDDAYGDLWISTNNGLCQYDPGHGVVMNYTTRQGLPGNEFDRYGYARTRKGTLYFNGVWGCVHFDPKDFHAQRPASATVITGLKLMNRPTDIRANADILPMPMDQLKELILPYSERMITFTFACMDHVDPAMNRFRYRLTGLSDHWIDNGTSHEAIFTNLDPGEYSFDVQGRNSVGVWDGSGATLRVIITPPWWGTWWFRALVVLAVAALLYAFYRYRLAQQLRLAQVRDRIARDLHDEIGSTLSSVALFSEVAKRRSDASETGRNAMLDRISASTSRMVESMNDIVWAVNSRNDELLHVAQRMQEFAGRVAEAVGFDLDFSFEGIDEDQDLDMVQRKNLYLIFKEAVNNAAKYSGCTRLTVRVASDRRDVALRVSDNGGGMDLSSGKPANGTGGGNGLRNMQARAKEMRGELNVISSPGAGTTVELRFKP